MKGSRGLLSLAGKSPYLPYQNSGGHLTITIGNEKQKLSTSEKLNINDQFLITGKREKRIQAKREILNTNEELELKVKTSALDSNQD